MKSLPGTRGAPPTGRPRSRLTAVGMAVAALSPAVLTLSCAAPKVDSSCPAVFIVQDLGTVSRFGAGGNREPANLQFQAEMRAIKGDCSVKPGTADVRMSFSIVGERGGNDRSGPDGVPLKSVDLAYFAAITDPSDAILWKQEFTTTLVFGDNRRAATLEELDPHIPLPKNMTASGYKVLLGFQLTPEEVAENRRLNGTATTPPPPPKLAPAPLPPLPPPPPAPLKPPARATPPAIRRPAPPKVPPPRAVPPEPAASTIIPYVPPPAAPPAAPYSGLLSPGYVAPNRPAPAPSATPDLNQ